MVTIFLKKTFVPSFIRSQNQSFFSFDSSVFWPHSKQKDLNERRAIFGAYLFQKIYIANQSTSLFLEINCQCILDLIIRMQLFDLLSGQIRKMFVSNGLRDLFFRSMEYYINLNLLRDGSFPFLCELVDYLIKNKKRHLIRCLILGFNPEKLKSDDLFTKCLEYNLLTPLIYMALFSTDQFVLEPLLFLKKYILDNRIVKPSQFNFQKVRSLRSIGLDMLNLQNHQSSPRRLFDRSPMKPQVDNRGTLSSSNRVIMDSPVRKHRPRISGKFSNSISKGKAQNREVSEPRSTLLKESQLMILDRDWDYSEVEESDRVDLIFTWYVYSFSQASILGQQIKRYNEFFLIFIDHLLQENMISLLFGIDWKTSLLIFQTCIQPSKKHLFFKINWNNYSISFNRSRETINTILSYTDYISVEGKTKKAPFESKSGHFSKRSSAKYSNPEQEYKSQEHKSFTSKSVKKTSLENHDLGLEPRPQRQDSERLKVFHSRNNSIGLELNDINRDTLEILNPKHIQRKEKGLVVSKRIQHSKTEESKTLTNPSPSQYNAKTEAKIKMETYIESRSGLSSISQKNSDQISAHQLKLMNQKKAELVIILLEEKEEYNFIDESRLDSLQLDDRIEKTAVHCRQLIYQFAANLMFVPSVEYFEFIINYLMGVFLNSQCLYFSENEYLSTLDNLFDFFFGFLGKKEFILRELINLMSELIQNNFEILLIPKVLANSPDPFELLRGVPKPRV